MSQLDSNSLDPIDDEPRGVLVEKPKTNVYTWMLIISFAAMCIACWLLYLAGQEYNRATRLGDQASPATVVDFVDSSHLV